MLYVFHVDTGTMMTFDMSLAIESVSHLKQFIETACKIPADKQVLLVSGGESLDPNARVCSYSAGTDTNPIFLFSKSIIESTTPPSASVDYGSHIDFKEKVKESQDMPATYNTVVQRAQLAQQFHESAKEQTKICERLVHEQHLQQQGWAAVVANLEDITAEFKKRSEIFEKSFTDYLGEHDSYLAFLQHFSDDLQTLAKIPVLPALLDSEKHVEQVEQVEEGVEELQAVVQATDSPRCKTLLEWISATDNKSSMDQLFDHCSRGLEQFDDNTFKSLHAAVENALSVADKAHMKEVKGLGDRLFGLEQLMCEAKRYVQEQADLAQSFLQNQNRAGNLGDPSILPDLCASHRKQLLVMLHNHQQLCDIRRRCTRAKEELSVNLYQRLKWVMYVENLMLETDQKLVVYHESLRRLRRHLEVLQQIHLAPASYLSAVAEVVRRRAFSQAFLSWASELACHLLTIHNDEVTRRKDFQVQFEGHFLNTLFPGMEDFPPSFATQAPSIFDSNLPKLTVEDVEHLKRELPDLTQNLIVPDTSAITNFFIIKSLVKAELDKVDDIGVEEKLVQVVTEVGLASNLDQNLLKPTESETCLTAHGIPHLKDLDRGCESETDTEEFEKVGQSPLELNFDKEIPSTRPKTQDVSTLTEDNLENSRSEHDRLKSLLLKMAWLAQQAITQLKQELNDLKTYFLSERSTLESQYESLSSSWENLMVEKDNKEREVIQRITVDHELEISDHKKLAETKNDEIVSLRNEISCLETSLRNSFEESVKVKQDVEQLVEEHGKKIVELRNMIDNVKVEKDKSVKEITEQLNREHKTEIENIRSRFRLMAITKMERSPSDTSLERIERSDIKELGNHESLILHIKENCEIEKQDAVSQAIAQETRKWEKALEEKITDLRTKYELEKEILLDEVSKRISEEKDKQIEFLREREASLNLECIKYKNTIQQLAECDTESGYAELLEKVEILEREKCQLEADLSVERAKQIEDMGASVAVFEGKVDIATSPIKRKENLTQSQTTLINTRKLSIDSCNVGDAVLVIWDSVYLSYTILQERNCLYFLHTDCLAGLGLSPSGNDRKQYCTGIVTHKEFCHAKKEGNRYKVPKGTKFYRIKVKPLLGTTESVSTSQIIPETPEKVRMSQSQTTGPTSTEYPTSASTVSHSLPVTPTKTQADVSVAIPESDTVKNDELLESSTEQENKESSATDEDR